MNRPILLCSSLAVVALVCILSVQSIGQDLFDSADNGGDAVASEDDLFAGDADLPGGGDDTSSEGNLEDLFDASDDARDSDAPHDARDIGERLPGDSDVHDFGLGDEPENSLNGLNAPRDVVQLDDVDPGEGQLAPLGHLDLYLSDDLTSPGAPREGIDANPGEFRALNATLTLPDTRERRITQALEQSQQTILQRYTKTKDKVARDKLTEQLTDAVQKEFHIRQQQRTAELKKLEAKIKRLWSIHQRREHEKNTIVRNRVRQLIRDKEGLGWGSGGVSQFR